MSDNVKQRLFEPYFTTKEAAGTGLGLSTVRDIAGAHVGDVAVESQVGYGTTITLLWPVAIPKLESYESQAAPPSGNGSGVLLVDDDAAVLAALGKSLRRSGFAVLEASGATAALEILRRGKLDIQVLCTDWIGLATGAADPSALPYRGDSGVMLSVGFVFPDTARACVT